ncbi:MupA/Atu3671 family FMN-dependent luciferase-like monooxygenase [Pontibaca salina]|uniref:LLM class flavin-dependent oxidoreductase n=1 Tax=Pontibaca salina TaxID=2795731 RepID=A0A934HL49_9RHOB|nr:MupA/Atu3671 family FMN-dependent luciferase-like monooxygenase [Pontibaca salina]MBI6630199.1 LLM class flavin-dependent oxidoreductase [Pontibaca salina]
MTAFSCVLIGDESLVIGCGDMLLERGHTVRAVISRDAVVLGWATKKGITTLSDMNDLEITAFDWLLSMANLRLIPETILALPKHGAINFHDGPLPRYAGLNTPAWALINRQPDHGVTWHMIEGGLDEGDILAQRLFDIAPDETAFSLNSKCYAEALESFADVVAQLERRQLQRQPQDLTERSYFARDARPAGAGMLDFTQSAEANAALVRGLDFGGYWNPLTCAKIMLDARVVLVGTVDVVETVGAAPGTVLAIEDDTLSVACAVGALRLGKLTDTDGQPLRAADLIQVGAFLAGPEAGQSAALDRLTQRILGVEPFWRAALAQIQPIEVPLARRADAEPEWASQNLTIGAKGARALALIGALALRSSGAEAGDIALRDSRLAQEALDHSGIIAPWVPLHFSGDETLDQTATRIQQALDKLEQQGGFAADLIARDPQITVPAMPQIGISLGMSAPVPGSALTIALDDDGATLIHDRTRLDDTAIALLTGRLEMLAKAPQAPIANLPVMADTERQLVLETWNRTATPYDTEQTMHGAFEQQVARTPDAVALIHEDRSLTYAQLNARANAVAEQLVAAGTRPGQYVGICLPRGVDLVIGAMAVLKAGGAYVPLDPAYPADRIAHYISDSGANVILTDGTLCATLPNSSARVVEIDANAQQAENVDGGATARDLAYVIYTSGSTGTPKGVMIEHRNVSNFFSGMDGCIDHDTGSVWLAVTSLSFDISVLELFWTLARGFKVVLLGDDNRAAVAGASRPVSERRIDFNLFYWGNDDGAGPKKYELLLEGAKFADENGFNAVWTPERHFHAFGGPYPNPSVTGAAVAALTKNLSVRAGSCVAPLHHPARIAEEWAVIDNLTNGRAGLAIASGWQPDDFVLRPENTPPANKPAMYEAIEKLRALWRGDAVEFPKADGTPHAVITQPRPVSPELPLWVTTAGNPDTWREAGEIGANVLTHLLGQTVDEVAGKIEVYHAALRKAGHDPADFTVTLMLHTFLAETRENSREIARAPMKDYLRSAAALIKQYAWAFPAFKRPEGVTNPFEMDLGTLAEDELEAILDFAFDRYFDESGLFGTVEDALARTEQLKRIGVDEIACLIDYGIAPEIVMEGLKPLAEVLQRTNAPVELEADDFSLTAQILRHDVTHLQCTPSLARMIAQNDESRMALAHLRQMLIGGEGLPGELVSDLKRCTKAQILNMYGPTETTVWSTVQAVADVSAGTQPIGRPIANTTVRVLDETGQPSAVGAPGELFIGGAGVVRGYWQRPDLTDEVFTSDPLDPQARIYRTGDLVRWRSDGSLDYLGRTDHQVKIRGQRIELGEIEATLSDFSRVDAAVVIAREIVPGDPRLLAYYTANSDLSEAELRTHLSLHLPEVMIPAHITRLDALPLTPNKKIDRNALPDPVPQRAPAITPPITGSGPKAQIAAIWSRILGLEDIRAEDNFFQIGGHSLLAVQAHREIRTALEMPTLSITDIFRFPTLDALAAHVSGQNGAPTEPQTDAPARAETMSKRRAMRAERQRRTG